MYLEDNYTPDNIQFDFIDLDSIMPESFGSFKTPEEAMKFLNKNMTVIHYPVTAKRFLDEIEKRDMRERYQDLLENIIPKFEKDHSRASLELSEAKDKEKQAKEMVTSAMAEVKLLASAVKRGVKEHNLEEKTTVRIPFKGKYFYYTYTKEELKLAAIRDIPEHEKDEIWNAMNINEGFIDDNFGAEEPEKNQS